jgi:pimeloyl-ACP methyl ester carboxylesterase
VFFFLHGNSGNLKKWFVDLDAFRQANFDVVMFDYRGFGKSSGQIESESSCAPTSTRCGSTSRRCTKASAW